MQYLLTEEEYRELSDRPSRACLDKAMDERQALCIKLALAHQGWCRGITGTLEGNEPCCDRCPSERFCKEPLKEYSDSDPRD
jgi:hypothetical protein